jgi:hypothetical protein
MRTDLLVTELEGRESAGFWRSFAVLEPLDRQRLPGA